MIDEPPQRLADRTELARVVGRDLVRVRVRVRARVRVGVGVGARVRLTLTPT